MNYEQLDRLSAPTEFTPEQLEVQEQLKVPTEVTEISPDSSETLREKAAEELAKHGESAQYRKYMEELEAVEKSEKSSEQGKELSFGGMTERDWLRLADKEYAENGNTLRYRELKEKAAKLHREKETRK